MVERLFSFWDAIFFIRFHTSARLQSQSSETCHKVPARNGTDGKGICLLHLQMEQGLGNKFLIFVEFLQKKLGHHPEVFWLGSDVF